MNKWLRKLCTLSDHSERTVLGVISGTSMDGVDLALCRVRGASANTEVDLLKSDEITPDRKLKKEFHELAFRTDSSIAELLRFSARLGHWWCDQINAQLDHWGVKAVDVDLVASHGQTLFHHPDRMGKAHATWQAVDGDLLAQRLGIITVSDFRQAHIAAGFEGAPLAPLGESLLFTSDNEDRILLNLGGIANFTLLPAGSNQLDIPFATDTGPANTLLDEAIKRMLPGCQFDEGGKLARSGTPDQTLLKNLLEHPYFEVNLPKSTGQEEFHWRWVHEEVLNVNPSMNIEDLLATLVELTVESVAAPIPEQFLASGPVVYVSGGGWHNHYMMERFEQRLTSATFRSSRELGLDPDAKEAVLFAVLGNEAVAGNGWRKREGEHVRLGKISLPSHKI